MMTGTLPQSASVIEIATAGENAIVEADLLYPRPRQTTAIAPPSRRTYPLGPVLTEVKPVP